MLGGGGYVLATALPWALAALSLVIAKASGLYNVATIGSSQTLPSTCPARSVNYITQTLPQQCARSTWTAKTVEPVNSTNLSVDATSSFPGGSDTGRVENGLPTTGDANASSNLPSTVSVKESATSTTNSAVDTETGSPIAETPTKPSNLESEQSISDSILDNANFLSFEEWKKQNLAKAGQSAENIGQGRVGAKDGEPRRRPGSINNALDSLGEDTEIEINFAGFGGSDSTAHAIPSDTPGGLGNRDKVGGKSDADDLSSNRFRSKDAGKTCKERSNYASFDCAATVLKTNPRCKGSTSVLVENKDSYMINECSIDNKFLIVELCNDILIDTIVLGNFEFFSSMFRTFRVSVSDRYPVKLDKWRELGTFEARNSREIQAFLVEDPQIWARYLRIEFLTHYGNEYYCPVSLLRVHGTTMMEEFKREVKDSGGADDDSEEEIVVAENDPGEPKTEVIFANRLDHENGPTPLDGDRNLTKPEVIPATSTQRTPPSSSGDEMDSKEAGTPSVTVPSADDETSVTGFTPSEPRMNATLLGISSSLGKEEMICRAIDTPLNTTTASSNESTTRDSAHITPVSRTPQASSTSVTTQDSSITRESSSGSITASSLNPVPATPITSSSSIPATQPNLPKTINKTAQTVVKHPPSSTHPHPSSPTTQESFFKSIHKRLQLLESNSTLSLQYIESQSLLLRTAFSAVEKRQLSKTTSFLDTLNTTVLAELHAFRSQYDQIWQSTVVELSSQRQQSQHEIVALSARLSLLADELLFQKRMAILQFALILLCLGLVIFSRSATGGVGHLELPPVVQNMMNKSSANFSRYTSHLESPSSGPESPSSTRPPTSYGLFRPDGDDLRSHSDDGLLRAGGKSPDLGFEGSTPPLSRAIRAGDGTEQSSANPRAEYEIAATSSPTTPLGEGTERECLAEKVNGIGNERLIVPN